MIDIKNEFIENTRSISGIFCGSNAVVYFGWGTIIPGSIQLLINSSTEIHSGIVWFLPTKDITNNLIKLPSGNFITNEDRTILERMNRMPEDEFVSQEMEDYGIEDKIEHLREFNNKYRYCSDENFELAIQCYDEWIHDPH